MAVFAYHAVDKAGRAERGMVEASTAAAARRTLRERNMLPVSVTASSGPGSRTNPTAATLSPKRPGRLNAKSLSLATRQLATLIGNDVRADEALKTVAAQTRSAKAAASLWALRTSVVEGRSLATGIREQGAAFPDFYYASVAAAEQSGKLGPVLTDVAEFVENRHATQNKIQLALLYPALLAVVSLTMITLLLIYVVPNIVHVFISRGVALPFLTQALIATSGFIGKWGLALVGVSALTAFLARGWLRVQRNRLAVDRFVANAPIIGRFSRQLSSARFASMLAMLVQSGVPLVEAMRAATAATPNRFIRSRVEEATARVNEGSSLRRAMEDAGCFTPLLIAMIASGESSGKLGESLERAGADQERDLNAMVATLVALVEPGVLLVMGGVVLMLVLAILMPIVNLNNLAGK